MWRQTNQPTAPKSNGLAEGVKLCIGCYASTLFWHPIAGSEMQLRGKSVHSWCDGSSDRFFMVDPLSYFSFQPVLHDWCNKGRGMCYPVCGIMHIKQPLLLIKRAAMWRQRVSSLATWVVLYHMSWRHITVNKMCRYIKYFLPSFLPNSRSCWGVVKHSFIHSSVLTVSAYSEPAEVLTL